MRAAKSGLSEILSSCEFIDQASLDCVVSHLKLRPPVGPFPFYVLLETSGIRTNQSNEFCVSTLCVLLGSTLFCCLVGSNADHDAEKLNQLLEKLLEDGTVSDGTQATDSGHVKVTKPSRVLRGSISIFDVILEPLGAAGKDSGGSW